jgi:hypothetical protein
MFQNKSWKNWRQETNKKNNRNEFLKKEKTIWNVSQFEAFISIFPVLFSFPV